MFFLFFNAIVHGAGLDIIQGAVFGADQVWFVAERDALGNWKRRVIFCCTVYGGNGLEIFRVRFVPVDNLEAKVRFYYVIALTVDESRDLRVIKK